MNENSILSINEEQPANSGAVIDPTKYEQFMREVRFNQNLPMAIFGGFVASLVAAVLWATLTYATNYKIGYAAIGVGFLVGYAVKFLGKGITPVFGVVGALFALFGCVFGDLLTTVIVAARVEEVPVSMIMNAFLSSPGIVVDILRETFSPIDLLFYAIAVYEGYKVSRRQIGEDELAFLQKTTTPPQTGN
jgi:hypothetical protein